MNKIVRYHGLILFIGFSMLFLGIRCIGPNLTTGDDPYLHAIRAYTLAHGGTVNLPAISSFNSHPVDLYTGYYTLFSPFTLLFDNPSTRGIVGSKVFHSLIDGLIALSFFILLREIIKRTKEWSTRKISWAAFVGTILLFATSSDFLFRLLIERPHLTSIAILLTATYALLAERYVLLGILAFVYPWFYSATFLIFIPVGTYALSAIIMKKPHMSYLKPIAITIAGLAIGILLHPDSLNYLYNGYYVHLLSIYETWNSGVGGPVELGPLRHNLLLQFELWYLPFLVLVEVFFLQICFKNKKFTFTELFINITAGFLFILSIFIVRTNEYAIPFALLAIIIGIIQLSAWDRLINLHRQHIKLSLFSIIIITLALIYINIHKTIRSIPAPELFPAYTEPVAYINAHINNLPPPVGGLSGDNRVFIQDFGMYARLAYAGLSARTISGMDSAFTLAEDPKAYWYIGHIAKGEDACSKKICLPSEIEDIYTVLKTYLHARYILIDSSQESENPYLALFNNHIRSDNRFLKIFTDEASAKLTVYELK